MIKSNLLFVDANRKIYTTYTQYKSPKQIKPSPPKASKPVSKAKPQPVHVTQPVRADELVSVALISTVEHDVEKILAALNVRTAYHLCEALNKIFKADKAA
jgi:hypothetical protein